MLKELYVVTKAGTPVYHHSFLEKQEKRDPVLLSAFITAIEGFSNEAFQSAFKGMEFENQVIYVVFNKVYFIGLFSSEELGAAAFHLLNKLAVVFNAKYNEKDYQINELDLTEDFKPVFDEVIKRKYSPISFIITLIITIAASSLFFLIDALITNPLTVFYSWIGFLTIAGIINGWIIPQRWIAIIFSFICTFVPSGIILFFYQTNERFFFADYTAIFIFFPWVLSSYLFEKRHIDERITPKIPIISRF